jgi:adenylate cyclase
MTASMVGAVVPSLQNAEIERARRKPPGSLDAYDLYLRALPAFYAFTQESNQQALKLAEQALALDPNFVAAVILAENCWSLQAAQGWVPAHEAHPEVMKYARRATQIDKDSAEALATLARRTAAIERNHEEAISLAEKAVALNLNSAIAWRQSGYTLVYCGEPEKALMHLQRAVRLSPRDPRAEDAWTGITLALIQLERDKDAVAAGRSAVHGNPNSASAWRAFAAALALAGQTDEARTALQRMLAIDLTCTATGMKARYGYTDKAAERYFGGMRKAGLPED